LANAQSQLSQTDATTAGALEPLLETIVSQLQGRGNGLFSVVLLPSDNAGNAFDSGAIRIAIPPGLRQAVRDRAEASTYVHLPSSPLVSPPQTSSGPTTALLVGVPLSTTTQERYELYFVFPLTSEQQSLDLVQRTFVVGGIVLVVLLAAISALVTRQVVSPVRMAARVASRFSAGHLQERMQVRGEDDLASLAGAFNDMAASLQRQIGRLERLSRVQQRFTADVSHELRTPLTTVRMAAEMLHAGRAAYPPEIARSAELLISELDRFESLLADLLEISRHDAGAAVLENEVVDLAALVRSEAQRTNDARGPVLDMSRLPTEPMHAEVDARRVSRIVRNLLSNAVEHGEGRPVELDLVGDEDTVALRVRDHGVGLRPGESSLVFGRFWRGDASRTRRTGGTGLGLSIALEDARLHGGWLQSWGEPGKGAAFRLVLPRRAGDEVRRSPLDLEPDAEEPQADQAKNQRIGVDS
jgi:two-component system sensor histidine kinase MtrB